MLTALVLAAWAAALFVVLGGLHAEGVRRTQVAVAAACLGPSAAAWMLGFSWRFVPGLPTAANIVFMLLVPLPALVWWLRRGAWPSLGAWRNAEALRFWGVLALLLAAVGYLVLRIPPYSNDPLEYAAVARLLNERRSLAVYPVLDSVLSGGLYAPWTHPPGFPMLMALTMMLDGLDAGAALKGVALMHLVLGVCGLALLVPRPVRWIAVLSLTATPAYLIGVVNGYVEAVRLTALIGVFSACLALWQSRGASSAMRLGLLFGLGGFVHSLGILSVAFFLPALVLLRHGPWAQRLLWAAAIVAVQVLVLAPDLWRNLALFGVVLGDRPEIWRMPEIDRAAYFSDFRSLSGPADKLLRGWLQGFTKIPNFGLTYWLPLLMGLWLWLARRRRTPEPVAEPESWRSAVLLAGCVVFTFFALAAALTLMGSVEAIKNARYILTVQPLVALVTAWMVMHLGGRALLRRSLAVLLLGCSLVPAIYMAERHPGLLFSTMSTEQAYFRYAQPEAEAVRQVERRQRPGHCALLFQ